MKKLLSLLALAGLLSCETIIPEAPPNDDTTTIPNDTIKVNPSIDDWPEPNKTDGMAKEQK